MNILEEIKKLKLEYAKNPTIEKLSELRTIMATAQDANNASEGFKNLLTQLYPDNAHFIYELLQNAEDASKNNAYPATVTFTLRENSLEFEHNGDKLFDINDIDAITGLGMSTKIDDKTNIGKFGVGFKSVFAITDKPEIISGGYHFAIERLFIPTPLKNLPLDELHDNISRFIFLFNNPAKAIGDIKYELVELSSDTLLFLKNINKIKYFLPNSNSFGYMERVDEQDGIIKIKTCHPSGHEKVFYWLKYNKDVVIVDKDGKAVLCPISIAYKLEMVERKDNTAGWKIVPSEPGKVCIFFPAEKETSKLRFYIHAPFASTVARDSVRECEENELLRDEIAELIGESLVDIQKRGLLIVDFLGVLPNPHDGLSDFYEQIRKKIVRVFQESPLVPTKSGTYAPGNTLFIGPTSISDVINDNDLGELTRRRYPLWAKNAPLRNSDEDRFIRSLEMDEFNYDNVLELFVEKKAAIENLIKHKDYKWLKSLYALLYSAFVAIQTDTQLYSEWQNAVKQVRIIKTHHKYVSTMENENVYILPVNVPKASSDINVIERETYEGSGNAEKFLRNILGIKDYSPSVDFEIKLKYYSGKNFVEPNDAYYNFLLDLAKAYNSKSFIDVRYPFLFYEENGRLYKSMPSKLALCKPYMDNGINQICTLMEKKPVAKSYYDKYNATERQLFISFLKDIDVTHKLTIIRCNAKNNPLFNHMLRSDRVVRNETNEDWTINKLEDILSIKSVAVSQLIWNTIVSHPVSYYSNDIRYARYSPNASVVAKKCESTLVHYLKNYEWIPDKNGKFYKPRDITQKELSKRFPYDDKNGLLRAIEFGLGNSIKTNEITNAIANLGIEKGSIGAQVIDAIAQKKVSESLLSEFLKTLQKSEATTQKETMSPFDAFYSTQIQQAKQHEYLTNEVAGIPNLDRRAKKLEEEFEQGLISENTINRVLHYTFNKASPQEKEEMYYHYQGKCQMCDTVIMKHNGLPHFHAINIINTRFLDGQFISTLNMGWNTLCLCPNCAAMYRYSSKDISTIPTQIKQIKILENNTNYIYLTFILSDKKRRIKFTPKHFLALQVALTKSEDLK